MKKTGRPRKYGSNKERQAAYRRRKHGRRFILPPSGGEITLDVQAWAVQIKEALSALVSKRTKKGGC